MSDLYGSAYAPTRERAQVSTTALFGQVMFLVGIAIGFMAVGSFVGRDLALGTARVLSFVAIGMLFAQSFVEPLRRGALGMLWLFGLSLILGLSLGPVLDYYVQSDPKTVTQAAEQYVAMFLRRAWLRHIVRPSYCQVNIKNGRAFCLRIP